MATGDIPTSLDNLKLERDAIVLYDALAGIERDAGRRAAFERIAGNERHHADIWAARLTELGAQVPATSAIAASLVLSLVALVAMGAGVSLLTGSIIGVSTGG